MNEDYSTVADADLQREIDAMHAELAARAQARADEAAQRQQAIYNAVAEVDALIGAEDLTEPNMTTLNGVLLYTDEQMQQNAGVALRLAFTAIRQLARIVRNLAAAR